MATRSFLGRAWRRIGLVLHLVVVLSLLLSPAAPAAASIPRGPRHAPLAPTATATAAPTLSPTVTATVPTVSPTAPTATPTATATATASPTALPTGTPTATATASATPLPTVVTPPPTITPTPTPTEPVTPTDPVLILPGVGGLLASPDGRLLVNFPPGAVDQPIEAGFTALPPMDLGPDQHLFYRFDLSAWPAGEPALPPPDFIEPVVVTVTFTLTDVESLLEDRLRLVTFDPAVGAWTPISATLDVTGSRLTAELAHFSEYALEGEDDTFFLPRLEAGQVSLFTGAASFSYELDVPAGAGGLKVPVTLQYDSGGPNGMKCSNPQSDCLPSSQDKNTDSGWVGVGWTLDLGKFEDEYLSFDAVSAGVKVMDTEPAYSGRMCSPKGCTPGAGQPWCICETGTFTPRRQQTKDVRFLKIESDIFAGNILSGTLAQVDVWTKDGTHYAFGSEGYTHAGTCHLPSAWVPCGSGSQMYVTRNGGKRVNLSYKLDTIVDTHGNRVEIDYWVFPSTQFAANTQLKESYPLRILYTQNGATGDNHAEYEIEFKVDKKEFQDKKWDKKLSESGFFLYEVNVYYHYDPADPTDSPLWREHRRLVRRYSLGYNQGMIDSQTAYELETITEYAGDEVQSLPPTTFDYTSRSIGWRTNGRDGGEWDEADRRFLATVDNGYGGTLTFGYAAWNCYDYDSPDDVGSANSCAEYAAGRLSWSRRQLVHSKSLSPGVGGAPLVTAYDYQDADVEWTRDPPATPYTGCKGKIRDGQYETCFEEFIGFVSVAEDWTSGGLTLKRNETRFYDTEGHPKIDQQKGKIQETWLKDGSEVLLSHTQTEYGVYEGPVSSPWPEGVQFVYTQQVTEETMGGGNSQTIKTENYYDVQGGQAECGDVGLYGNLIRTEEYEDAADPAPYRTTVLGYCPNATAWIVDKPAFQEVHVGDAGGALQSATFYVYSDNENPAPTWNQAPGPKGELRGVRRLLDAAGNGQLADTRYWHDAFGNVEQETTYSGYGTNAAWASIGPQTTTTTYDTAVHVFPIQVTNPLGQSQWTNYYGVNETNPEVGHGLPGQVKRSRDANDAYTFYQYDDFGRSTFVWLPGDVAWEVNWASQTYTYDDAARRLYTRRRDDPPDASGPTYLETWRFFDGLGRPIQDQAESAAAGEIIVTNRTYDELGRLLEESLPYTQTVSGGTYRTPDWGRPHTAYTYDAAGRPLRVTNPDATWTEHHYGAWYDEQLGKWVWYDDTLDPNRHRIQHRYDGLGRMIKVQEIAGDCSNSYWDYPCGGQYQTPWTVYATTLYGYDAADNLVGVTDAAGNVTTIHYDSLGRKKDMGDPDMGSWDYGYDAVGNLTVQDDAKHQRLCFYYDELNRLTGKYYTTDTTACPTPTPPAYAVSYGYDAGPNGIGRRTSMADASGSTTWGYDLRGRMTSETKAISGSGLFATRWTYDAADRPWGMIYPANNMGGAGETVITTYDNAGRPKALVGAASYVANTTYNAPGQVHQRWLGNAGSPVLTTSYSYYPGNYRLQWIRTGPSSPFEGLQKLEYTYDAVGNVVTIKDYKVSGGTQTQAFTYDFLDRLVSAEAAGGIGEQGQYDLEVYDYYPNGNVQTKAGVSYGYTDAAHKHAVTTLGGVQKYWYDANGNMTTRIVGSDTYIQTWDAENRLVQVSKNGGVVATYVYDGDGNRVKATVNGGTTAYVGNYYEWRGGTATMVRYYYLGGQRVAMRTGTTATQNWVLSDHLGSTAVTANYSGGKLSEVRYKAYGETRYTWGTMATDYRFTGQRLDSSVGLYLMGARWYDSSLSRWLSPDSIVPEPSDPQTLNRYSYVNNRPIRYRDPSGHMPADDTSNPAMAGGGMVLAMAGGYALCVALHQVTESTSAWIEAIVESGSSPSAARAKASQPVAGSAAAASSAAILQEATPEISVAMEDTTPSLEIPNLQASAETVALELPTVHEAGKNTPVPGQPGPREKLLPESKNPRLPIQINTLPKAPPGPPRFPTPTGDMKARVMWAIYLTSRILSGADTAQIDQWLFDQEWPIGDFPY